KAVIAQESAACGVGQQQKKESPQSSTQLMDPVDGTENFDILNVSNAGFKLEFVSPDKHDESSICEIEIEDISSGIAY
ncbi:hypothetical protein HAX54_050599, partial [Datura stramonium]|nr:hypothetical protein [Datura stramonium]